MLSQSPSPTVGSILVGGFLSTFLSGTVFMQLVLYFRLYPNDALKIKFMVVSIWILDIFHTVMICLACWDYLITNWANNAIFDYIPWCYGSAHISNRNIYLTAPIALLASLRVIFALVSMAEMIRLNSYSGFVSQYGQVYLSRAHSMPSSP
ncbi:hypothetical protein OBBRIDRAFT_591830 [Obba rivulosa]|uniref:Uncharacterized protein n=1 Tax=Obba rivulosa TaxID=1052685 RepID=A0A8E2AYD3_9APHY|nr:hypothetical protein OBBRIDRAFT_591830 [Obba rivulosa]